MSRIGKLPIQIPAGVSCNIDTRNNMVTIKGTRGELNQKFDRRIKVSLEDGLLKLTRSTETKKEKSLHGLYRALINNMVIGVSQGFSIVQEVVGVGYRVQAKGQILELNIGYSHPIHLLIPSEVKITTETVRRDNPKIKLESCNKQLIGQVAAKIRSFRKPEPYKGKGIRFLGEQIKLKAGKTAKV